ncbi:MAG: peptidylprolyl isomerase [Acidobacteriota bacterium]
MSVLLLLAALAMPMSAADASAAAPAAKPPHVLLETSVGSIEIELNTAKAPISAENFLQYVKAGFYDGVIFHRVIPGFMIQGGGFAADMQEKATRSPIKNESNNGVSNARGTLAMARTNAPDSAAAQFFINLVNNSNLDYPRAAGSGYAVFGRVVSGMDVVDKIAKVQTATRGSYGDVPVEAVVIKKATVQ